MASKTTETDLLKDLLSRAELPANSTQVQFGLFSLLDAPQRKVPTPPPPPGKRREQPIAAQEQMTHWLDASSLTRTPRVAPFVPVAALILRELESSLSKLLSPNTTRKAAMAAYLESLAGIPVPGHADPASSAQRLAHWIEGPRSPAQNAALQQYFEEMAVFILGEALILKAWSDRGLRAFTEKDVGSLNWVLLSALKPHVPLDREGWQVTQRNIYSWFNPSAETQAEIWKLLKEIRITDEGPEFLARALAPILQTRGPKVQAQGFDSRFYASLWKQLHGLAPEPTGARRVPMAFTPTLRDGGFVRLSDPRLQWVGLESQVFPLIWAELMQLWWGPQSPPLWAQGTGLEVHTRDQLSFSLQSVKPSLLTRIAEMEACEFAWVLEEHATRTGARTSDASAFKEQLDQLPYFKKLRAASTTQGELQACVALSKLRPQGWMIWGREEPLTSQAGKGVLEFLLERGCLVAEWDLSGLDHALPSERALFPRYVYLWRREGDLQARLAHRPLRIRASGQLRSHVELQSVLDEVWAAAFSGGSLSGGLKGALKLQVQRSPSTQRDWIDRWPDPTEASVLDQLERMREGSSPLGGFATIRATPESIAEPISGARFWKLSGTGVGLWLESLATESGPELRARPLPRPGEKNQGQGWLVLLSDSTWAGPLLHYLSSTRVRTWLNHHAEIKAGRWVLSETLVRSIPLSKMLLQALHAPGTQTPFGPLPGDWERLAADVPFHPGRVQKALAGVDLRASEAGMIHAGLYVRAARALEAHRDSQARLLGMVTHDGRIRWRDLISILPKAERVAVTLHPAVRLMGNLPLHLPISRWERTQRPHAGIVFVTETGFQLTVCSESRLLLDMLADQLDGVHSPTWNELIQHLSIPRRLDLAEATASDVLRSHGEQVQKLKELELLLESCRLF